MAASRLFLTSLLAALGLGFQITPAFGEGLSAWQAQKPPRLRIAASPYPNWLLHVVPTGADFGQHLYRVRVDTFGMGPSSEASRGHFYTRCAGFLDLSHIRRTIDFAGYVHYWLRESLLSGAEGFAFESIDRTTYRVRISYPDWWGGLPPAERDRLAGELALRKGLEAAYDFSNWREILTWHGFYNVPGMPERESAFSFEDLPSHAVGLAVAERALRAEGLPFDEAVTRELARELLEIEVAPRETYHRAMELVAGKWWDKRTCLRRFVDTGADRGWIEPWLVPGLESGPQPRARRYPVPTRSDRDVLGRDCRGLVALECEPRPRRRAVREKILPEGVSIVVPAKDYPAMQEAIRQEILAEFGPLATVPDFP
jgi:hypothetical protein